MTTNPGISIEIVAELLVTNSEVNSKGMLVAWKLDATPIIAETTGKLRNKARRYAATLARK